MSIHAEAESDRPLAHDEVSRIWQVEAMPDVELLFGSYRRFAFSRHFHEGMAMGVVEAGAMRLYCNGKEHVAGAGSVVLINPGDVHAPQAVDNDGWRFRMLYVEPTLLAAWCGYLGQGRPVCFSRPVVDDPAAFAGLRQLHCEMEASTDRLALESGFAVELGRIARFSEWSLRALSDAGSRRIGRAKEYLHAHWRENVSITELAEAVELSPYHLVRAFHERVGIPPHAYLMQLRISHCRELLRSGVSLAETAFLAGFVDQSHFTRHFKKFTGVTPGRYLQRC